MARVRRARDHVVVGWPRLSLVFVMSCSPTPPTTVVEDAGVTRFDASSFDAGVDAAPIPVVIDGGTLTTIASGLLHPLGLAVDGKDVFWVDGAGNVDKCMAIGCSGGLPITLATGQLGTTHVAVDAIFAYWVAPNYVMKCTKVGCQDSPTQITNVIGAPEDIAVDTNNVYFSQDQWGVSKYPLDGGQPQSLATGGQFIAIDATNVYIATDNVVSYCNIAGCNSAPTTIANQEGLIGSVTVDGTDVYWTNYDPNGTIRKCAKGGCGMLPTTIAFGQNGPSTIAVDDTNIYWVNYDGGQLMRCPKANCTSPTVLVSGLDHPVSVVLDSASVYWTNSGSSNNTGSVMQLTPK